MRSESVNESPSSTDRACGFHAHFTCSVGKPVGVGTEIP